MQQCVCELGGRGTGGRQRDDRMREGSTREWGSREHKTEGREKAKEESEA